MLVIHKLYCIKISPETKIIHFYIGFVISIMAFAGHRKFDTLKVKIKNANIHFSKKYPKALKKMYVFKI